MKVADTELAQKREQKYLEIITTLNKRRQQGNNQIYDCGDLGFAWIYWDRYGWNVKWFEPVNADLFLHRRRAK